MSPVMESVARKRSERRIAVRLPLRVRGRDARGVSFEEETASENLCRSGAAFRLTEGEKVVGVQFVGPRFQRVFRSESSY